MSTTDTYITRLILDDSQHQTASKRAEANTASLTSALSRATVVAGAAIAASGGFIAGAAIRANAELDSLMRGLAAVAGSAEAAQSQFARLREVAKLPGLGLKEAVQGSINLQAAGFSAGLAEAALSGFGNALATVGKGREDLFGVITALSQIASKGKISAEEINQIAERVPQIRQIMKSAFGTADTEALQKMGISSEEFVTKITVALNKLPKATGGIQNSFENLKDGIWQSLASLGSGINRALGPIIDKVGAFFGYLSSSGILEKVGNAFGNLMGGADGSGLVRFLSYTVAVLEQLPSIIETISKGIQSAIKMMYDSARTVLNGIISVVNYLPGVNIKPLKNNEEAFAFMSPIGSVIQAIAKAVEPRANEIMKGFNAAGSTSNTPADLQVNGFQRALVKATEKTAENTSKLVDAQRSILGGNDLGRMGVAPIELRRINKSSVTINANGPAKLLESYIQGIVVDALKQYASGRAQRA